MGRANRILVTAAWAALAGAAEASAQTHTGLWFGGGAGYGSAQTCYDLGCGERKDSPAGYLQAGYTLGDRLLAGGEFGFWSKTYKYPRPDDYARVRMYQLTGVAMYYPRRAGLFVKGGAGLAFIDSFAQVSATALDADLGSGFGFVAGGGYDFPVGPIAVTPAFNYWYGRPGDLTVHGETIAADHRQNVMTVTLGITIP